MSFKPENASNTTTSKFPPMQYPKPKAGSRKARLSLIVDMGTQEREDIYELNGKVVREDTDGAVAKQQKPCHQVAVFADLVVDNVDYGGDIGEQQYRLMLNQSFMGKVKGINFTATPPKDADGNTIAGAKWGFHPSNVLTKIAKAVGMPDVIESMEADKLLDKPFMATVEVKSKPSGKQGEDGEEIIYHNVNFKGATAVPLNDDDTPMEVAALKVKPMCITFKDAKKEQIQFIRYDVLRQIKEALNYEGSNMQKAVEAFEEERSSNKEETPKTASKAPAKTPKAKPAPNFSDMDDDIPF